MTSRKKQFRTPREKKNRTGKKRGNRKCVLPRWKKEEDRLGRKRPPRRANIRLSHARTGKGEKKQPPVEKEGTGKKFGFVCLVHKNKREFKKGQRREEWNILCRIEKMPGGRNAK